MSQSKRSTNVLVLDCFTRLFRCCSTITAELCQWLLVHFQPLRQIHRVVKLVSSDETTENVLKSSETIIELS